MNFTRFIVAMLLCLPMLSTSCSGSSYEFIPATPVQIKGEWEGTYSNNHKKDGVITATFFVDEDVLKVTYDVDNGYATGTSDVELDMRVITFYGIATDLAKFECSLNARSDEMYGQVTIDYGIHGTHTGPCELRRG